MNTAEPLNLDAFMKNVASIVQATPALAPLAYAKAAAIVRAEIRKPENRGRAFELYAISRQIDLLAAQATVYDADPIDAEQIAPWADDPEIATEFDGVVAAFEAAKSDANGEPVSELAHAAEFTHLQRERREQRVRPVQITPASADDASNLFGDTVLVQRGGTPGSGSFRAPNATTGILGGVVAKQEEQIIRWNGNSNGESLPCRVAIGRLLGGANATFPTASDASGNSYSYRPFFHAFWGTGERGQACEVYGDVGRGTQFTVNASNLYVNVGMDAFSATVNVSGAVNYVAGAMYLTGNLGFFAGQSQAPVQRTVYIDELADAQSTTFDVPRFAQDLLPPQSTATNGQTTLSFRDAANNVLYSLLYSVGTIVTPIPIGNDVHMIRLTNTSGGTQGYRLVFRLAL